MVNVKVDASLFMFLAQCVHFFSPQKFARHPYFLPNKGSQSLKVTTFRCSGGLC